MQEELDLEKEQQVRNLFSKDKFASMLGITLKDVKKGYASAAVKISSDMLNGARLANGGICFTLADFVLAVAANTLSETISLSLSVNINYIKAAKEGDILTAVAQCCEQAGKVKSVIVNVTNQMGEVLASVQGITIAVAKR